MPEALLCPKCGKTVPADAPRELCPACLMQLGFASSAAEQRTMPPIEARDQDAATLPPAPTEAFQAGAAGASVIAHDSDAPKPTVPGYIILSELGRGGMGVVYKAKHVKLGRLVALKMILAGSHAGEGEIARFRTEAEAIARLKHENIIQIYEIGEHEGKPYFSLEFCSGGSLADKIDGTPMQPTDAARMVEKLARAMEAAHQQDVIHRDLKPANILMSGEGRGARGESDASAAPVPRLSTLIPKITDFGLAKKLDEAGRTQDGSVMGTPSYMAPEQAEGKAKKLGPPADIYALGAILYELLTGRPPFKAATPLDTILQVVSDEPVPPSQLQHKMPRDVETICLKCLQKDPAKRYESAKALANDLRRYLKGEPIEARPVGTIERVGKWVKRRPMVAGLMATVALFAFVAFVGISGGFGWALVERKNAIGEQRKTADALKKAEDEKALAEAATKEMTKQLFRAENLLYVNEFTQAHNHFQTHDLVRCQLALDDCNRDLRGPEYGYLVNRLAKKTRTLRGHISVVSCLALSHDGKRLISGGLDSTIKVWDPATDQKPLTLTGHADKINCLALSKDGKRLFSGSLDKTIKVWDLDTGTKPLTLSGHMNGVITLVLSDDNKRLISGSLDRTIKVWDLNADKQTLTLRGHAEGVTALALSGDGTRLYSGSDDSTIKIWDLEAGNELQTLRGITGQVSCLRLSGAGKQLISGSNNSIIKIWDLDTGKELFTLRGHAGQVSSLKLDSNGKRLFSACLDGSIKAWDLKDGKELFTLRGHTNGVSDLALSRDDKQLFSASWDSTIKVWNLDAGEDTLTLRGHAKPVTSLALSNDGKRLYSGAGLQENAIKVWDIDTGKEIAALRGDMSVALTRDAKWLLSRKLDSSTKVWNVETSKETVTLQGLSSGVFNAGIFSAVVSHDGKTLYAGDGNIIKRWDLMSGKPLAPLQGHTNGVISLMLNSNSTRLYSGSWDSTIKVWDVNESKEISTLRGHERQVGSLALSGDGKRLFSGCYDSTIKVWDLDTGKSVFTLRGHTGIVRSLALSSDATRLFSASEDKTIKVWNVDVGKEILTLRGHTAGVASLALSGDARRLFSGSQDTNIKIWDLGIGLTDRDLGG